jgi:hypothetical protein
MTEITKELLTDLQWKDFSVLNHENSKVLVLIYDKPEKGKEFLELLHEQEFDLRLLSGEETNKHIIEIQFLESNLVMRVEHGKTEEGYPLKDKLREIIYLSTGIINPEITDKKHVLYDTKLKSINLG